MANMRRFVKSYIAPSKNTPPAQETPPVPSTGLEFDLASIPGPPPIPQPSPYPGSAVSSRPASIYPIGDFRNGADDEILEIKSDTMVNYMYQDMVRRMWTHEMSQGEGVVLKKRKADFICCPRTLEHDEYQFFNTVKRMNVRVSLQDLKLKPH
jgi:hypothetical protein